VAATLAAADVHGVPTDNHSCAVAVYMNSLLAGDPSIRSVAVGHCSLVLTLVDEDHRPAGRLHVQMPKPVRQFVAAFDAHQYPEVMRSEPPGPSGLPTPPAAVGPPEGSSPSEVAQQAEEVPVPT
jgi:hypothetical protein